MTPKPGSWGTRPPEERRRKGRLGGHRAHRNGAAHRWTKEEAAAAGHTSAAASDDAALCYRARLYEVVTSPGESITVRGRRRALDTARTEAARTQQIVTVWTVQPERELRGTMMPDGTYVRERALHQQPRGL